MFDKKKMLVAASIAGLMASSTIAMAGSAFPGQDSMNKSHCSMNGCKGMASRKGEKHSYGGHKNGCKSGAKCDAKAADTAAKVADGKLTT